MTLSGLSKINQTYPKTSEDLQQCFKDLQKHFKYFPVQFLRYFMQKNNSIPVAFHWKVEELYHLIMYIHLSFL